MKEYLITGKLKGVIVFDKTVIARNKADAWNDVKDELFKINRQLEINITEVKEGL